MPVRAKILVVDDEVGIVDVLRKILRSQGYRVRTATSAREALDSLEAEPFDLMIADIRMAPMDGLALLDKARALQEHLAVIMMTAYAAVETAVESMRKGAFDYVCKPFKINELLLTVERALSYESALAENESLKETIVSPAETHFGSLIGDHPLMQAVYRTIRKVAPTDSTVLILGESGTGKELVARAIHDSSPRSRRAFVAVNCASLPETLLESELFGYMRGSFTGANRDKKGLFETADGGTLFLDEVGSIPNAMQLTLLRVLQEQEIRPVGSTRTLPVNVRIIAATHEHLESLIAQGRFREDLFYRLSVIPIELPPLRDRMSDLPLLVNHFLAGAGQSGQTADLQLTPAAMQALQQHAWPGNIRELENVIRRAATFCEDGRITAEELPPKLRQLAPPAETDSEPGETASAQGAGVTLRAYMRDKERAYLRQVLEQHNGNKEAAARSLGISLATFYRKYDDS
ncbi:MAG: sigma-54-dependent Fis family transcriptional regulator [Lentisphaeria bacterium]|nr:sigma-54-dependent Fis family transcriptional regulator [Lentisphaeria bacterium]